MTNAIPPDAGEALVDQVFRLWVNPAIVERGLDLTRADVVKALVIFPPHDRPAVLLNDDVVIRAQVQLNRAVEAGEPVTLADVTSVGDLEPAEVDPNAGWIALARIGAELIVAFDFRRNRGTAAALISRAREFSEAALPSLDRDHVGPAIENGFAAAELAVKAEMYLMDDSPTTLHHRRVAWWEQWVGLGNAPAHLGPLLDRLYRERGAARYGDADITMSADDVRLALENVSAIIDHAEVRCAQRPLLQQSASRDS